MPESNIGNITVRIDRDACIGSGNCIKVAPEVFQLDDEVTCAFKNPLEQVEPGRVVEACRVCPVQALIATDSDGNQLVP